MPFAVLTSKQDGQSPFLHQTEVLVCGGIPRLEQVTRYVSPGLGQVACRYQPITAVVARSHQYQYSCVLHPVPRTDGLGHRPPGLLHHLCVGVACRVGGSLDATHLVHTDNLHNQAPQAGLEPATIGLEVRRSVH